MRAGTMPAKNACRRGRHVLPAAETFCLREGSRNPGRCGPGRAACKARGIRGRSDDARNQTRYGNECAQCGTGRGGWQGAAVRGARCALEAPRPALAPLFGAPSRSVPALDGQGAKCDPMAGRPPSARQRPPGAVRQPTAAGPLSGSGLLLPVPLLFPSILGPLRPLSLPAPLPRPCRPRPLAVVTRSWRDTVFLPKTSFPMRGRLAELEPRILALWDGMDLFARQREESRWARDVHPPRRPPLRQRQAAHRHRPQQSPQRHHQPHPPDAGGGCALHPRVGLPRPADRVGGGEGAEGGRARARRRPTRSPSAGPAATSLGSGSMSSARPSAATA